MLAQRERRFAAALLAPAFLALLATTTFPLMFLVWTSAFRMDLAMPFADGFVGLENYRALLADDPRFWSSLLVSLVYTSATVVLQVVLGLALALLVMDMKRGQGWFRVVAILPVVLSPAVVGMIWRTFMLAPDFGIVDYLAINAGIGSRNWLGDPQLALISVIVIHTWQWTPFAFLVLLARLASLPADIYEAARLDRATRMAALPAHHAAADAARHRDGGDHAHDDGAVGVRGDLRGDRRRSGLGDRDPEPVRLPQIVHRAEHRLRRLARHGVADRHAR